MQKPLNNKSNILITIPTLGERLDLLEKTLESIRTQEKIIPNILIVCPSSSKEVMSLATRYGAKTAEDPGTLSGALNIGIVNLNEHHDYFAWMGDDDLLRKDSLLTTSKILDDDPTAVIAYGACDYIDEKDKKIFTNHSSKFAPWLISWGPNLIPLPGMLYRISALNKAGIFDTDLKYAMDLDMLLRLKKYGKFVKTNKTLAAFRWHASSTTVANREKSLQEAKYIKRKYLPKYIQPFSFLWEFPVAIATKAVTYRINKL